MYYTSTKTNVVMSVKAHAEVRHRVIAEADAWVRSQFGPSAHAVMTDNECGLRVVGAAASKRPSKARGWTRHPSGEMWVPTRTEQGQANAEVLHRLSVVLPPVIGAPLRVAILAEETVEFRRVKVFAHGGAAWMTYGVALEPGRGVDPRAWRQVSFGVWRRVEAAHRNQRIEALSRLRRTG